jgi:hypothetical protein
VAVGELELADGDARAGREIGVRAVLDHPVRLLEVGVDVLSGSGFAAYAGRDSSRSTSSIVSRIRPRMMAQTSTGSGTAAGGVISCDMA